MFVGKPLDWYSRYHRKVQFIELESLYSVQYNDHHSDLYIKELIRNRKQRATENVDTYYDAFLQQTDRLDVAIPSSELVEILKKEEF